MKLSMTQTIKGFVWSESPLLRGAVLCSAIIALIVGILAWVSGADAAQGVVVESGVSQPIATATAAKQVGASPDLQGQKYEGMITDTHCGARHSAAIGLSAADCARACVHGGNSFALVDGDTVYVLDGDAATLKKMAGQRVHIIGTLNGNKISVSAVTTNE